MRDVLNEFVDNHSKSHKYPKGFFEAFVKLMCQDVVLSELTGFEMSVKNRLKISATFDEFYEGAYMYKSFETRDIWSIAATQTVRNRPDKINDFYTSAWSVYMQVFFFSSIQINFKKKE